MTKDERINVRDEGKIIIRAQLTRWGWRVMQRTDKGGWTPLIGVIFPDRISAENACTDIEEGNPEKYVDDN
jgi:hypothetical protein